MGRRRAVAALLAAAVLGASPAGAQQNPPKAGAQPRMKAMMQRAERASRWWEKEDVAVKVGVSTAQKQQLDAIADTAVDDMKDATQSYAQAYARFITVLSAGDSSTTVIEARRQELERAGAAMFAVTVDRLLAMRDVLSPAQWSTLREVQPAALQIGQMRLRGTGSVAKVGDGAETGADGG